ncbi:MAG: hypothetical protein N7Q72_05640, partial [Spiroplasma sp. Tabriz.8]|nr:hypothetical protein [Spiroplasma sp. Tabriz.8]
LHVSVRTSWIYMYFNSIIIKHLFIYSFIYFLLKIYIYIYIYILVKGLLYLISIILNHMHWEMYFWYFYPMKYA